MSQASQAQPASNSINSKTTFAELESNFQANTAPVARNMSFASLKVRKKRVLGPNMSILTPYFPPAEANNPIKVNNIDEKKPAKKLAPLPLGEHNFA